MHSLRLLYKNKSNVSIKLTMYMAIVVVRTQLLQNIQASFDVGNHLTQLKQGTTHFRHESLHIGQSRAYFWCDRGD